jgi:hypothetical protein
MVLGLVAVLGLAYLLWTQIYIAFLHNPALNSGIFVVLLSRHRLHLLAGHPPLSRDRLDQSG